MKELVKKLGAFSLGPIIGALLGFITIPIITNFISAEEYGKSSMFLVAQSTISLFLYLGLDQAFVREFHIIKGDKDKLLTNVMLIPLICMVMAEGAILTNVSTISIFLFESDNEVLPVLALALLLPFMIVENFALLKIRMEEKGLQYSFFTILLKSMVLILTVLLLFFYEKSFRSVVYAMSLAEVINGTVLYLVSIRKSRFSFRDIDKELLVRMLKFGLPIVPASMIGWLLGSMDKIMLRSMSNFSEVGLYAAAFKIVTILGIIQTCFTLFWTPVSYRWFEEDKAKKNFENISKLVAVLMTLMCVGLLLCKDLVGLILGKSFIDSIYIFPFLLLFPVMYTMSESTAMGIGFMRRTSYNILISSIAAVVNVVLNYNLIPIYGGIGAAIATGISYVIFFWARTLISRSLWWKFPIGKYVIYTLVVIINCGVHTFLVGYIPYTISFISILLILGINLKDINEGIRVIKTIK